MQNFLKIFLPLYLCAMVVYSAPAYSDDQNTALEKSLLKLQNQVSQLEMELAEFQGKYELLNHEYALCKKENESLKQEISKLKSSQSALSGTSAENVKEDKSESQVLKSQTGGATAVLKPSSVGKGNVSPAAGESQDKDPARELYQASFDLMNKGDFEKASAGFKQYLDKYQGTALEPNAWYWLGQMQYRQKKYEEARVSFLNTAKFDKADKRPDALYKLGITSKALGDPQKAKKFFELLIRNYPNSSSSVLAKQELENL